MIVALALAQAPTMFGERLEEAKGQFFAGDLDAALQGLQALQLLAYQEPDAHPWPDVVEAMSYLGEIWIRRGADEQARSVFRFVLERDPDAVMSPYRHPIEVVFVFDQVKEAVQAERSGVATERVRLRAPWHSWMPFGVAQAAQGRSGAAWAFGGTQAALAGVSIGMFAHLSLVNTDGAGHPLGWDDDQVTGRVQLRRYAVQWPATAAFHAVWVASVVDARRALRREKVSWTVAPSPGGWAMVGRF